MIIHYSILAVILVVGFVSNNAIKQQRIINRDAKTMLIPWLIIFGYIAFLACMRSAMNDTRVYIASFEATTGNFSTAIETLKSGDIRYVFTNALCIIFKAYISDNYHMWFLLFAVVESVCFIYVYRRESYDIFIVCFFFFASTLYYNYFSMMRQWMAVAICFGAFDLLKKKKYFWYILCCLLGFLFHPSAVVCIVLAFLAMGKPWQQKQIAIILAASVAIIFLNPILSRLDTVLEDSTYDYALDTMLTNSGSSPVRILISAVPVILAYVFRDNVEKEDSFTLNFSVNMAVFFFFFNVVATFTSGLYIIRLATYIEPYIAILYSYLLTKGVNERWRGAMNIGFIVFYFALFLYQTNHMGAGYYISDILGTYR